MTYGAKISHVPQLQSGLNTIGEKPKARQGPQLQHAKLSLLWKQVDGDSTARCGCSMSGCRGAHAVEPLQG